jgi:uncharacterized cupredoxin-like copper-binding protein
MVARTPTTTTDHRSTLLMRTSRLALVALAALALLAAACGSDDSSTSETTSSARTVKVTMQDNEYVPDAVSVAAGETVRFEFTNAGAVDHDAFIGDAAAQDEHEVEMSESTGMAGHHMGGEDQGAITVEPGKTGTLTHRFSAGEKVLIGCHEPGHYDGGMKIAITVS